jgi:hypothetical protein
MQLLPRLRRILLRNARKSPREHLFVARHRLIDWGWKVPHLGNDRTTYVIGLFGTGRWYINFLIMQNVGERAQYFRDAIRLQPGPTSMIYSGHATMKYISLGQASPAIMSGTWLQALHSIGLRLMPGLLANEYIFVCRKPVVQDHSRSVRTKQN